MKWLISLLKAIFKRPKKELPVKVEAPKVRPLKPLAFKKKSKRLHAEFHALHSKNPELHELMLDLQQFMSNAFGKNIVITMIFRTPGEQAYLYRNSRRYKRKPFKSPHQFWQAIDIRSKILGIKLKYSKEETSRIINYLNNKYNAMNYYPWTAKIHEIGTNGLHFHIQFVKR